MNTQDLTDIIKELPTPLDLTVVAYGLRDAFKDKAANFQVYDTQPAIKELDTMTEDIQNLRTILKAIDTTKKLQSFPTSKQ